MNHDLSRMVKLGQQCMDRIGNLVKNKFSKYFWGKTCYINDYFVKNQIWNNHVEKMFMALQMILS